MLLNVNVCVCVCGDVCVCVCAVVELSGKVGVSGRRFAKQKIVFDEVQAKSMEKGPTDE
jgi:hypothetical protein